MYRYGYTWICLCIYIYVSMYIYVHRHIRVSTKEALKVCWTPTPLTVAQKSKFSKNPRRAWSWVPGLHLLACDYLLSAVNQGVSQYSLGNITSLSFILPLCWSQAERLMQPVAVVTLSKSLPQTGTLETQYSFSFSKAQTSPIQVLNYSG